jgi:hypothetical protein
MSARHTRLFTIFALALASNPATAAPVVFHDAGATGAAILDDVNAFRAALGAPDNINAAGPLFTGRREINWDGGGATNGTPPANPFTTFFNTRGAFITTPAAGPNTGLQQALPASGTNSLAAINPTYGTQFVPFSLNRVFTPIGSNITDVTFFLPGSNGGVPATVSAFGAVFLDVDLASTTTMQFFDPFGIPLGSPFAVDAAPGNATFSFLGVQFDAGERIRSVRITTGNTALGPTETGGTDIVVMDDFLYAEPRAVPEPGPLALFATALVALFGFRLRTPRLARKPQA